MYLWRLVSKTDKCQNVNFTPAKNFSYIVRNEEIQTHVILICIGNTERLIYKLRTFPDCNIRLY